jgi:hypothetical protein
MCQAYVPLFCDTFFSPHQDFVADFDIAGDTLVRTTEIGGLSYSSVYRVSDSSN